MPTKAIGNKSQRFHSGAALNAWREAHGLFVAEMAIVLGMPLSTFKDKLYARTDMTMRMDRAINNIEMLLKLGCPPSGWPARLHRRVLATFDEYDTHRESTIAPQSPETRD